MKKHFIFAFLLSLIASICIAQTPPGGYGPSVGNNSSSGGGSTAVTGLTTQGTGVDSGVANAYVATVTFPTGMSATTSGSQFSMIVNNSNTAASTINVNGAGAFGLIASADSGAFSGGELTGGKRYTFLYLGSNKWVVLGSRTGVASLTSDRVTGIMMGPLGINGATSVFQQGFLEFFTPFTTSSAPTYRTGITFSCFGSSGCVGQQVQIGYDADGVFIISGFPMAFINNVESFNEQDMFGSGTSSSVILNVNDSGHPGHTSGNIFNVIDKNARTNIAVTTNAVGTKMTMDDFGAIGTQNVSGCSLSAAAGGSWAGKFVSGTTGTCTVTITFPDSMTTGWACDAHDTTTVADVINQTGFSQTTATISGTTASGDVITWKCAGF